MPAEDGAFGPVLFLRLQNQIAMPATAAPTSGCSGTSARNSGFTAALTHGDYWREYRAKHPDYTDRNRVEQRRRDRGRRSARLAKMDASTPISVVPSGTYRLLAATAGDLAKKDAWTVKITVISKNYEPGGEADAILQREDVIGAAGPAC